MQHCLRYCVQHVSVEVATRCIITSNEDRKHGFNIASNIVRSLFQWRLQHAATLRVMRTGNVVFNLLCNIEYSIFQWRWLHASTLRKTRTKNIVQHCPKFCAQHFSVDSLHAANIACNIVCSGGGYTLQTLSATKTGNMVPLLVPLLSPPPSPHPTEVFELFLIVILT